MSLPDETVNGIVGAVLGESEPLVLANESPERAAYLRRAGALRGLHTDAEIEAAANANRPAVDAALDEIAKQARR